MTEKYIIALDDNFEIKVNYFIQSNINHIFNTSEFFNLYKTKNAFYFQLSEKKSSFIYATIHFTETSSGVYRSPSKGTFGGISSKKNIKLSLHEKFLDEIEKFLVSNGANSIEIVTPPAAYSIELHSVYCNLLLRREYEISNFELNYELILSSKSFSSIINYGNRKRLNKCKKEGFITKELEHSFLKDVYSIILENRFQKGFPITMSYDELSEVINNFPDRYLLFGVFYQEKLVASSICISISKETLYVFYWGDKDDMKSYSPITFLAETIYNYARDNCFSFIDVGISTFMGIPNYNLIQYKKNLGCSESIKLTYHKSFT